MTLPTPVSSSSAQEELEKRSWALSALSAAAAALARANSTDMLIAEVCDAITSQSPYLLAWVGKAEDDNEKTIKVLGGAGTALDYIEKIAVSWSDQHVTGLGPAGLAVRSNQITIVADTEVDPGFIVWQDLARKYGIRSAIACPIADGAGHPFGALVVYSAVPNAFGSEEAKLFESLAHELSFGLRAIERQQQLDEQIHEKELVQERLAGALKATIEAMSRTMEWRDPYTAGHQKRVALISAAIAKKIGLNNEQIEALYMAAMVHDLGKVAVPAEILTKPSRLSDLEMKMVQGHAESGYQILKDIPFPYPIAEMVYQHHERLDGSGYPRGLKGDAICLEARILAVADTIEAMATHRPYRPGKGLSSAMSEVMVEAGSKLDQRIADAAFELYEDGKTLHDIIEST
jgi:putative nucleotidyltransferase with HDIG domain